MKATETEFSAKSRRQKFGIWKAIPKASPSADVPRNLALVISRTRPSTLEHRVRNESESPFDSREPPAEADGLFGIAILG